MYRIVIGLSVGMVCATGYGAFCVERRSQCPDVQVARALRILRIAVGCCAHRSFEARVCAALSGLSFEQLHSLYSAVEAGMLQEGCVDSVRLVVLELINREVMALYVVNHGMARCQSGAEPVYDHQELPVCHTVGTPRAEVTPIAGIKRLCEEGGLSRGFGWMVDHFNVDLLVGQVGNFFANEDAVPDDLSKRLDRLASVLQVHNGCRRR